MIFLSTAGYAGAVGGTSAPQSPQQPSEPFWGTAITGGGEPLFNNRAFERWDDISTVKDKAAAGFMQLLQNELHGNRPTFDNKRIDLVYALSKNPQHYAEIFAKLFLYGVPYDPGFGFRRAAYQIGRYIKKSAPEFSARARQMAENFGVVVSPELNSDTQKVLQFLGYKEVAADWARYRSAQLTPYENQLQQSVKSGEGRNKSRFLALFMAAQMIFGGHHAAPHAKPQAPAAEATAQPTGKIAVAQLQSVARDPALANASEEYDETIKIAPVISKKTIAEAAKPFIGLTWGALEHPELYFNGNFNGPLKLPNSDHKAVAAGILGTIESESSFQARAQAKTSSAYGYAQFIGRTWEQQVSCALSGNCYDIPRVKVEYIKDRTTIESAVLFTIQNYLFDYQAALTNIKTAKQDPAVLEPKLKSTDFHAWAVPITKEETEKACALFADVDQCAKGELSPKVYAAYRTAVVDKALELIKEDASSEVGYIKFSHFFGNGNVSSIYLGLARLSFFDTSDAKDRDNYFKLNRKLVVDNWDLASAVDSNGFLSGDGVINLRSQLLHIGEYAAAKYTGDKLDAVLAELGDQKTDALEIKVTNVPAPAIKEAPATIDLLPTTTAATPQTPAPPPPPSPELLSSSVNTAAGVTATDAKTAQTEITTPASVPAAAPAAIAAQPAAAIQAVVPSQITVVQKPAPAGTEVSNLPAPIVMVPWPQTDKTASADEGNGKSAVQPVAKEIGTVSFNFPTRTYPAMNGNSSAFAPA